MKGMLFKDYFITRRAIILCSLYFLMAALIMLLIRISMDVGNLASNEEVKLSLLRNMWVLRYIPPAIILLPCLDHSESTIRTDLSNGWLRFARTTSVNTRKLIAEKYIFSLIETTAAFAVGLVYELILCAVSGDSFSIGILFNLLALFFFTLDISFFMVSGTLIFKGNTFRYIAAAISLILPIVLSPFLLEEMKKYDNTDVDLFDVLKDMILQAKGYFLPVLAVLCLVIAAVGIPLAVRAFERREL